MNQLITDARHLLELGATSLLLRHAERFHISDPTTGNNVPLTENGRATALQLGRDIAELVQSGDAIVAGHSPVLRCEETAKLVAEGMVACKRFQLAPHPRGHLGGHYLRDPKAALELARDKGIGFVRHWFNDEVSDNLVAPFRLAAQTQIAEAMRAVEGHRLAMLVSHDWNIMLVREFVFDVRHETTGWPDYLEGIAMTVCGNEAVLAHRGIQKRLHWPLPSS